MLRKYLLEKFGYNEPIFVGQLSVPGMSDNALRQAVKWLVFTRFLLRYDTGIYYIPKPSNRLGRSYLDPYTVILRKYVKNDSGTYGYVTGAAFANQLGLTTQMPAVMEIVTNKESTKGRFVTIGGQTVRIKRPPVPITKENADILQFLDVVSQAEKYSELDRNETILRLKSYLQKYNFTQAQLSDVIRTSSGNAVKKLVEWGLVYDFTPNL